MLKKIFFKYLVEITLGLKSFCEILKKEGTMEHSTEVSDLRSFIPKIANTIAFN